MAVFTANAAQTTAMPKGNRTGLVAVTSFWSWDRSVSVGTTIQMVKVPAGGTPLFVQVGSNNAGQSSVSVGDGINNSRYLNNITLSSAMGMVIGGASGTVMAVAAPYTYSTDDTIDIFVSLVSITTIGGAFYLTTIISMDVQPTGTVVGLTGGVAG